MNPRSTSNNDSNSNDSLGEGERLKEPPFARARVRKGFEKEEEDGEMMTEYSSALDNFLSSPSPFSSSLYSSMKLPTTCLNERDGCDEAELIARAKRCKEILKLSEQAAIAAAEKVRIANIKPLVWAKPTFGMDSTTADTAAVADETQRERKLGKRKGRQERRRQIIPRNTIPLIIEIDSSLNQDGLRLLKKCRRLSTLPANGFHLQSERHRRKKK